MMTPFLVQARSYAQYHVNPMTRYTHMAGVPLLLLAVMILLGFIHIVVPQVCDLKISSLAMLVLFIYYLILNWRLALATAPILIIITWIANLFSSAGPTRIGIWACVICFVLGGI